MPIYESKRAIIGTVPALALNPAPTLAGILDDLETQIGADAMKVQVMNIMQHSAKSFILHLVRADQVEAFMARDLTFRGQLLEFAPAKNTTTVILDRVPYGLPEARIHTALARYGEVKAFRPVLHKGYGLSKFKLEMVLKQDITSRITIQGNAINVFYRNQPRSCFVCSGAGHEAKNCPRRTTNKRAAPADTTSSKAPKAPRMFAAAIEPATDINPPAGTVHDQPAVAVLPPIQTETGDLSSNHPGPQQLRVPQPATDPPPAAAVATTTSDKPSGPPASATPIAQTLPASNLDLGTQEPESTPQMDTSTSSIPDPTVHSMDPFPNLDQYFADSPPAQLRPRPDTRLSSSASQSPTFRSKRSGGVHKKSKSSPASQTALAAGVRIRTTPQAVTGARRRGLNQNQFRVLTDDPDGSGDPDLNN